MPPGPAPEPPPGELLVTAYDNLHSMGIDLAPYTRLFSAMKARIEGDLRPLDPAPATFVDGVACQAVLDAIRHSAREHSWVQIQP